MRTRADGTAAAHRLLRRCVPLTAGTAYGYADLVALLDAAKGKEVPLPTQNGGDVLVRPTVAPRAGIRLGRTCCQ